MYHDHDDDFEFPEELARQEQRRREAEKQEFIKGCYQAYDILATQGSAAMQQAELPSIQKAINRMTAFFLLQEEYERCGFLKGFVEENIPGWTIDPDWTVEKNLTA
jgi:endo-1,4-beta-D-glucanase Y